MIRGVAYPLRTRCKYGHAFSNAIDARGARECQPCHRRRTRESEGRRRAAAAPTVVAATFSGTGGLAPRRKPSDVYVVVPPAPVPPGQAAVVLCECPPGPMGTDRNRYRKFDTVDEALDYARSPRCSGHPHCIGRHIAVWRRDERIGSAVIDHNRPRLSLAEELDRLYPRSELPRSPEFWSTPLELNEALEPRGRVSCAL